LRNWLKDQRTRHSAPQAERSGFLGSFFQSERNEPEVLESCLGSLEKVEHVQQRISVETQKKDGELSIPLVEEGLHPNDSGAQILGAIRIRRSIVPDKELKHLVNPFAWRITESGTRRVHRLLRPRDVVIISEDLKKLEPKEIFAVRYSGRLILSRVLQKGSVILLLSSQGETEIEVLDEAEVDVALVGRVALVIRAWHYAVFSPSDYREG
jgi:hypothetical protein